ncbi:MAG: Stealth CR1 domain-containing protein, partial [Candidatus Limnocylindrales bacterium]
MPDPGRPLAAAIAQRLDIGASRFAVGPSLGYDIPEPALERLLRSTLSGATERGLLVMIDMRTHMDRLTSKALARHAAALRRRSTFRLFVLDGDTMVENVCIRPWAYSGAAAWRARADSASVGRIVEGLAPGIGWPVRTDTTIDFPVDAVYTWVNGRDPAWREQFARFRDPATLDPDRFNHSGEFRYSMRSLDLFGPWIRRIHIVSNCPAPPWFEASDRVRWVDHGEFIPAEYLPLFSSRAIDTFIHRVPDLSEHFV